MKTILESVKNQTNDFKIDYLNKCRTHLVEGYNSIKAKYPDINQVDKQVAAEFGISSVYFHRKANNKANKIVDILHDFRYNRIDKRIEKELIVEEKNFELKQARLADRLEEKGMTSDATIRVDYSYPNLEGFAKDGEKQIHFYTIIAEGEVQTPHFRYLFK